MKNIIIAVDVSVAFFLHSALIIQEILIAFRSVEITLNEHNMILKIGLPLKFIIL